MKWSLAQDDSHIVTCFYRFAERLKTLGLSEELRNPAVFYNMFVSEELPLQAKDLCTLFQVDFSVQGSNRRDRENMTIWFWRDWLIDIEGLLFVVRYNNTDFISAIIKMWSFCCPAWHENKCWYCHSWSHIVKSGCVNMGSSLKLVHIVL